MRLGDQVDFVIGVDTHKHSHTLGIVDSAGADLVDTVGADGVHVGQDDVTVADARASESRQFLARGR